MHMYFVFVHIIVWFRHCSRAFFGRVHVICLLGYHGNHDVDYDKDSNGNYIDDDAMMYVYSWSYMSCTHTFTARSILIAKAHQLLVLRGVVYCKCHDILFWLGNDCRWQWYAHTTAWVLHLSFWCTSQCWWNICLLPLLDLVEPIMRVHGRASFTRALHTFCLFTLH